MQMLSKANVPLEEWWMCASILERACSRGILVGTAHLVHMVLRKVRWAARTSHGI